MRAQFNVVGLFILASFVICDHIDMGKNTQEMAIAHNYPCENYTTVTPDGYILRLYRIPGHQNESLADAKKHRRQPVILQHGMLDSSDTYLINEYPALAYVLADKGYDVWIGNFRGNKYSRQHTKLNPDKDRSFWNFSIDELIKFDLKTIFSKVIEVTDYQMIHYMGHSMGAGSLLAAASRDPEFFANHVKTYVGFAPSTRSRYASKVLHIAYWGQLLDTLEVLGVHEILSDAKAPHSLFINLCRKLPKICILAIGMICDKQPEYDNTKKYVVLADHFPAGTSNHVMKHLVQHSAYDGYYEFRKSLESPLIEYDFTKFPESIPVALFPGKADTLVNTKDVQWLKSKLGKAVKIYKEYEGYGHLTFLIPGKTYDPYNDAIAFIGSY